MGNHAAPLTLPHRIRSPTASSPDSNQRALWAFVPRFCFRCSEALTTRLRTQPASAMTWEREHDATTEFGEFLQHCGSIQSAARCPCLSSRRLYEFLASTWSVSRAGWTKPLPLSLGLGCSVHPSPGMKDPDVSIPVPVIRRKRYYCSTDASNAAASSSSSVASLPSSPCGESPPIGYIHKDEAVRSALSNPHELLFSPHTPPL